MGYNTIQDIAKGVSSVAIRNMKSLYGEVKMNVSESMNRLLENAKTRIKQTIASEAQEHPGETTRLLGRLRRRTSTPGIMGKLRDKIQGAASGVSSSIECGLCDHLYDGIKRMQGVVDMAPQDETISGKISQIGLGDC